MSAVTGYFCLKLWQRPDLKRRQEQTLYNGPAVSTNSAMNSSSAMPVSLST